MRGNLLHSHSDDYLQAGMAMIPTGAGPWSGVMTERMFQGVYDVEELCSSSSQQARCDVALDMGHSARPAGHKLAQGSPHDDKWVWTGCCAGAVSARLAALGARLEAR
jgi:hypothetical protein